MKQRVLFLFSVLFLSVSSYAARVSVVVADSANSLIPKASVRNLCSRKSYTTSVDGRAIVMLTKNQWIRISADGYKSRKMRWNGKDSLLWVTLTPKPAKQIKRPKLGSYASSDGVVFYSMSPRTYTSKSIDHIALMETMEAETELMDEKVSAPIAYGKAGNNISAGKLTAGEVNDFAKWYQWPSIIDDTLKDHVSLWRIVPRHRYTVQVTNKEGFPIVSRAVSLLDHSGNTIYQAVTDNTGKAELWNQLISNNLCGKHAGLKIRVDNQVIDAKDWYEGLNHIILDEPCEASETADVLFVVDATGSMGDEIYYLQAEMKDVIRRSQNAVEGLQIRTGAVFYRDYSDDYLTRISRLTDNIETTQQFIDKQHANGGGDYEEAIPEALKAALNVSGWNEEARARIIFLVLDAPCHKDSATLAMLHEQILNASAMGVRIVPVVCSGLDKSAELLMREIALATNGTSFFLTDDSGIGDSHIKPSTDSLKVEHLNDMLVRTIQEFTTMPSCTASEEEGEMHILPYIPNPFEAQDLISDPSIPHGESTLYLIDMSGKVIAIFEGEMDAVSAQQISSRYGLSNGVYLLKAFYDGQWNTKKLIIR